MDKISVVKLPAMHCSYYELQISCEEIFVAMLRPIKSAKIFNLENFWLYNYGSLSHGHMVNSVMWRPYSYQIPNDRTCYNNIIYILIIRSKEDFIQQKTFMDCITATKVLIRQSTHIITEYHVQIIQPPKLQNVQRFPLYNVPTEGELH